ncbi:MAG: hypothetical protein NXI18_18480 [Alphaproteobacteria bacterium]|nr:hypothetical protein [Alphaproteobacteria bacterium]
MDPKPRSPSDTDKPTGKAKSAAPLRWAGHGHIGAFLMQVGILIGVNLALWGVVFLMALKFAGVIGVPEPGQ